MRIATLSSPTRRPTPSPYLKAAAWSLLAAPLWGAAWGIRLTTITESYLSTVALKVISLALALWWGPNGALLIATITTIVALDRAGRADRSAAPGHVRGSLMALATTLAGYVVVYVTGVAAAAIWLRTSGTVPVAQLLGTVDTLTIGLPTTAIRGLALACLCVVLGERVRIGTWPLSTKLILGVGALVPVVAAIALAHEAVIPTPQPTPQKGPIAIFEEAGIRAPEPSAPTAPLTRFTLDVNHGGGDESIALENGWTTQRFRCVFSTDCRQIVVAAHAEHQDVLLLATREEEGTKPAAYTVTDRVDVGDLAPDHWLASGNVWTVAASQDREPCNHEYAALIHRGDRELTTLRAWDVVEARFVEIEAATVTFMDECGA